MKGFARPLADLAPALSPEHAAAWLQDVRGVGKGPRPGLGPGVAPASVASNDLSGADPALLRLLGASHDRVPGPEPAAGAPPIAGSDPEAPPQGAPGARADADMDTGAAIDEALDRCGADLGVSTDRVQSPHDAFDLERRLESTPVGSACHHS